MENFKYLWREYRKEILVLGLILISLLIIGGSYYFYSKKDLDNITEDIGLIEKEEVEEEVSLEIDDKEEASEEVINVQVDIKGEVKKPGVYVTTPSSRVIDIINSAGGLTKNADTSLNNLSRKVQDEMVIIIYSKKEVEDFSKMQEKEEQIFENLESSQTEIKNDAVLKEEDILTNQDSTHIEDTSDKTDEENANKISINTASKDELMTLSGIGESKADAIIKHRTENGTFKKIEDIMEVSGIGQSVFDKIKDSITI